MDLQSRGKAGAQPSCSEHRDSTAFLDQSLQNTDGEDRMGVEVLKDFRLSADPHLNCLPCAYLVASC